jgi:hypothetical protein
MGDRRVSYAVLMGRSEGKKPLGRSRHRSEYIVKRDFKK